MHNTTKHETISSKVIIAMPRDLDDEIYEFLNVISCNGTFIEIFGMSQSTVETGLSENSEEIVLTIIYKKTDIRIS